MLLKKPLRKHVAAKNRKSKEIGTLTIFASENGVIVVEDVVEEEGGAMSTIVGHPGTQDLRRGDDEAPQTESTIEVYPRGARLTPIYQEDERAVTHMSADAVHLLFLVLHLDRVPVLGLSLHPDAEEMIKMSQNHDVVILQADLRRLFVEGREMAGYAELQIGVMIVQDPPHLQKPLAHVLLEHVVPRDVRLPSHPVAVRHRPDATDVHLRHRYQGHVLVHLAEITRDGRAGRRDHRPMPVMVMMRWIHALIIAREEDITTIVSTVDAVQVAAAVVAETWLVDTSLLHLEVEAQVLAEIGNDIDQLRGMHLQLVDDAIPLPMSHHRHR